jgi:hypothetical protein
LRLARPFEPADRPGIGSLAREATGEQRMVDWRLRVLGLLAATLALSIPASASGAATIGSNPVATANSGSSLP